MKRILLLTLLLVGCTTIKQPMPELIIKEPGIPATVRGHFNEENSQ